MGEAALDAAETDHNVLPWTYVFRRSTGVLVGECSDEFVGKLLLHGGCHLVDKPDDHAGFTTIGFGDGLTFIALTGIVPVVLGDVIDQVFRTFPHSLLDPVRNDFKYIGVGQTELRPFEDTFAIHQTVIFGMFFVEFGGWHQREKGMDCPIALDTAGLFAVTHGSVHFVARGPGGIEGFEIEVIPYPDTRFFGVIEPDKFHLFPLGNHTDSGSIPSASEFPFEEFKDAVHRASLLTAGNKNIWAFVVVVEGFFC